MKKGWLIVVAGPTAVGKTSTSIKLASSLGAEIISADSRQFYQEMAIGTAKPSDAELSVVPHHFINQYSVVTQQDINASSYEKEVLQLLEEKLSRLPAMILTGGSGLYINAVTKGFDHGLPSANLELRNSLKRMLDTEGIEHLRKLLFDLDPEYFKVVDLNNSKRLMRAIEVCKLSGIKYSELREGIAQERPFNILKIGLELDRESLNERINLRVNQMMDAGLLEEAKALYPYKNLNALKTVGYSELFSYFEGIYTLEQAVEKIKVNTRRYAKRQMTWFKKDLDYTWFNPSEIDEIINYIHRIIA